VVSGEAGYVPRASGSPSWLVGEAATERVQLVRLWLRKLLPGQRAMH